MKRNAGGTRTGARRIRVRLKVRGSIVASGFQPDVEGGILPPGPGREPLGMFGAFHRRGAFVAFLPPGWKPRLHGGQDARRHAQ